MKADCKMCGNTFFHCPTGEHVKEPGKIHSGRGAKIDSEWDCPNCRGKGVVYTSLVDRICEAIYRRGRRVNRKLHPTSF